MERGGGSQPGRVNMYTHADAAGGDGGGGSFAASAGMAADFTPATPLQP